MNEQQGVRGGSRGWLTISLHTYVLFSRLGLISGFYKKTHLTSNFDIVQLFTVFR